MAKDNYDHPVVVKWREKIREADGFIICTPEYNHGYPAVLKNAIDYVYSVWGRKAVAFVSWGGTGGARGVEQLRLVAVELDMVPIRWAVHIPNPVVHPGRQRRRHRPEQPGGQSRCSTTSRGGRARSKQALEA